MDASPIDMDRSVFSDDMVCHETPPSDCVVPSQIPDRPGMIFCRFDGCIIEADKNAEAILKRDLKSVNFFELLSVQSFNDLAKKTKGQMLESASPCSTKHFRFTL